mmetsp:Transcript_19017/g.71941  ORF Transcript_19017/g.71941 Transcript_19017/m.71941 type:complete len:235 (-) Transcript_19017:794-1498(-)
MDDGQADAFEGDSRRDAACGSRHRAGLRGRLHLPAAAAVRQLRLPVREQHGGADALWRGGHASAAEPSQGPQAGKARGPGEPQSARAGAQWDDGARGRHAARVPCGPVRRAARGRADPADRSPALQRHAHRRVHRGAGHSHHAQALGSRGRQQGNPAPLQQLRSLLQQRCRPRLWLHAHCGRRKPLPQLRSHRGGHRLLLPHRWIPDVRPSQRVRIRRSEEPGCARHECRRLHG